MTGRIKTFFKFEENRTNFRTETIAGLTTFMTMSYIIFVNPAILSASGMDFNAVMMATCIAAAIGTLVMGLIANYPIALAPGMGLNAFFTFEVCIAMNVPWQVALGMVFVSGCCFFILTLLKIREMILNAIPQVLKLSTAAGIGLFIAFIGFKDAGIVVDNPATFVSLGDLASSPVLLAVFGLLLTSGLLARHVKGAIIIGIIATAILGIATGLIKFQPAAEVSIMPTLGKLNFKDLFKVAYVVPIITLLFVDMFDTIGTLIGVSERAGFLDEKGNLPRASRALASDAAATVVGAFLGTSTTTSYIESAAGISEGGRTGFANIVTAVMFLLALLIAPLAQTFGGGYKVAEGVFLYPVTAPALIVVGCLMMSAVKKINWSDYAEAFPAFFTILAMPLTFSISNGLALGFITYSVIMVIAGRAREVHPLNYALAVIFLARYIFL